MGETVNIFYSYSREDAQLRNKLARQLYHKHITHLHDRLVQPGIEKKDEIEKYLDTADIILLLISPDFMASDYCYSTEMRRALERHERKEARVIPIILWPVDYKDTPLGNLQELPKDGQPVGIWNKQEQEVALFEIAKEILLVAGEILKEKWLKRAKAYIANRQYKDALNAYEHAIHIARGDPLPYQYKGDLLFFLERFTEAEASYQAALKKTSQNAELWVSLGRTLAKLRSYDEALAAYKHATGLTPHDAVLSVEIGDIYFERNHFAKALTFYDHAISIEPHIASFHMKRGDALLENNRQEEALAAYEKAILLEANNALFHSKKGDVLLSTSNYKEALAAYEKAISLQGDNPLFYKNKARALSDWVSAEEDSISCFEEALMAYDNAISLDPNDPFLRKEMGDTYFSLNSLENALESYEDAIRLKPDFGLAYRSKGEVLEQIAHNFMQQAQQAHDKAKELGISW